MQDHYNPHKNNSRNVSFIMKFVFIAMLNLFAFSGFTQQKIILSTPDSETLYISDLWNVQILNNSDQYKTLFLHGSIEGNSMGLIYEGITDTLEIPAKADISLNSESDISNQVIYSHPHLSPEKNILQIFPHTSFTVCTSIICSESQENLDSECIRIHSSKNRTIPK